MSEDKDSGGGVTSKSSFPICSRIFKNVCLGGMNPKDNGHFPNHLRGKLVLNANYSIFFLPAITDFTSSTSVSPFDLDIRPVS